MLKTRLWVALFACAALVLGLLTWRFLRPGQGGAVAEVLQDGVLLREIDLSAVTEEYAFEVAWPEGGKNTVRVRPGDIRISDADCPDQICVNRGWLSEQAGPIVCLPHRLMIRWKGAGADALVR